MSPNIARSLFAWYIEDQLMTFFASDFSVIIITIMIGREIYYALSSENKTIFDL